MAKRNKEDPESMPAVGGPFKELQRQLRKLGRGLETTQKLEAKRARQLDKLHRRGQAIQATINALRGPGDPLVTAGPKAYCMREKRTVAMADPVAMVMRNGRDGLSGTCPSCGARVITTARKETAPNAGHAPPLVEV